MAMASSFVQAMPGSVATVWGFFGFIISGKMLRLGLVDVVNGSGFDQDGSGSNSRHMWSQRQVNHHAAAGSLKSISTT